MRHCRGVTRCLSVSAKSLAVAVAHNELNPASEAVCEVVNTVAALAPPPRPRQPLVNLLRRLSWSQGCLWHFLQHLALPLERPRLAFHCFSRRPRALIQLRMLSLATLRTAMCTEAFVPCTKVCMDRGGPEGHGTEAWTTVASSLLAARPRPECPRTRLGGLAELDGVPLSLCAAAKRCHSSRGLLLRFTPHLRPLFPGRNASS